MKALGFEATRQLFQLFQLFLNILYFFFCREEVYKMIEAIDKDGSGTID